LITIEDCQAEFDFTQHRLEHCDGQCWKSVDLVDKFERMNSTGNRFQRQQRNATLLKSSRRCFSADELVRAAELGINTSNGCRQVKQNEKKIKEICFCSDQDMCNASDGKIDSCWPLIFIVVVLSDYVKHDDMLAF
jgi:hypothetical protein